MNSIIQNIDISGSIDKNNVTYPAARICRFMLEDYLFNIKKLLREEKNTIGYKWYDIDQLNVIEKPTIAVSDSYLKNIRNSKDLGRDIMRNGTFFPLFVIHTDRYKNQVFKGTHRIESAKLLRECDEWDGKKFLALDFKLKVGKEIWEKYPKKQKLEGDNWYRIPTVFVYPNFYDPNFDIEETHKNAKELGYTFINEEIILIPIANYRDLVKVLNRFARWLNELIFLSQIKFDQKVQPSAVINDRKFFQHWLQN